jgi:hypothetical protein
MKHVSQLRKLHYATVLQKLNAELIYYTDQQKGMSKETRKKTSRNFKSSKNLNNL